jgi:hypothetical protein
MTLIPDLQRDLVEAAGRVRGPRLPARAAVAGGVATVTAAAVMALLVAGGSDEAPAPGEPAAPPPEAEPGPPPSAEEEAPPDVEPPRPDVHPIPGSHSERVALDFAGVRYSIVGFRSEGSVCTALAAAGGGAEGQPPFRSCLAEALLRQALADTLVHTYGGGGGTPTFTVGFARAAVSDLSLTDPTSKTRVVLSEPWSPEPWEGDPIRFVYVITDGPPETTPQFDENDLQVTLEKDPRVEPAP